MPITIVATFECATIDEFNECMAIVRDNEPTSVSFSGSYTFIPPEQDQTPPYGTERSEAFAKTAEAVQRNERKLVTGNLYEALYGAAKEYRLNNLDQRDFLAEVDCQARCVDNPQAMPHLPMPMTVLSCMRDLRYHIIDRDEFEAVCHELGRDAWGAALVPEPPL